MELIPSTVTDEVSALKSKSVDAIWIFYGWAGVACEVAGLDLFIFKEAKKKKILEEINPPRNK